VPDYARGQARLPDLENIPVLGKLPGCAQARTKESTLKSRGREGGLALADQSEA